MYISIYIYIEREREGEREREIDRSWYAAVTQPQLPEANKTET